MINDSDLRNSVTLKKRPKSSINITNKRSKKAFKGITTEESLSN